MAKSNDKPQQYLSIHGWFDYEDIYQDVFKGLKKGAHVVEVGCWLGRSACYMGELIKNSGKSMRFDCIDTWRHPVTDLVNGVVQGNKESQVYDFINNLETAGVLQQVNVIQLASLEAVKTYEDGSLDFIFLDNDHSEEHVFNELNAWWPKVKKGGTLAGHDYVEASWPGVVNAVKRFTKAKKKKFDVRLHSFVITR